MIARLCSSFARSITNATLENPAMSLRDPRTWDDVLGGTQSDTGIRVTHQNALSVPAFLQGGNITASDAALAPMDVYRRIDADDREIDWKHPAEYLISEQPNEDMSAFEFWRRLYLHAEIWGNGYAYIARRGRMGDPIEMVNILPDRTKPVYDGGELFYVTEVNGQLEPLYKDEVFHLKGISIENAIGVDIVDKARNTLGLAMAAQGFASKFFANGAQAGGILEIPPGMPARAIENIEEGFRKRTTSKENWFKTAILRDGAKFQATTIDAEKSQLGLTSERRVREIARLLNIPGFKLNLQDSFAYNSAEMSQLVYLMGTLSHRMAASVGEAKSKLLRDKERRQRTHYIEHNVSKLIEIDVKTMNEVLEIQRRNEIINANEWRRKINLNKRPDPGGNDYFNPNTKSAASQNRDDGEGDPKSTPPDPSDDPTAVPENRTRTQLRALVTDAVNRASRRVCFDARNAAKKPDRFLAWLDSRASDHRQVVDEMLAHPIGLVGTLMGGDGESLLCSASGRFFTLLLDGLSPLTEPPRLAGSLQDNVDAKCAEFERDAPENILSLIFPKG